MMQRDVGIKAGGADQGRNSKTRERRYRPSTKGGKEKIEPNNIRLFTPDGTQQTPRVVELIDIPDALDVEAVHLAGRVVQLIRENGQAQQRVLRQLASNMEPVFVQPSLARGERTHQTDLHRGPLA